jgi:hypothetical protein
MWGLIMSWTQVTTMRRYTKREKKAYQLRKKVRAVTMIFPIVGRRHYFADGLGSRVPTMRVNPDVL